MPRNRRRRQKTKHRNGPLAWVLGGVALSAMAIGLTQCPESPWQALTELDVDGTISAWPKTGQAANAESPVDPPIKAGQIRIYLDTSQPMGGYLGGSEGRHLFRKFFKQAQTQLVQAHGGHHKILWFDVAQDLSGPRGEPDLLSEREFTGKTTNLNLAIGQASDLLSRHELDVALLVTDLVPTSQIDGAAALIDSLLPLLSHSEALSGEIDVGLFSVKVPYRGVSTHLGGKCDPPRPTDLGCFFSEDTGRWQPMDSERHRPLHFLLLGRSFRVADQDLGKSSVQKVGEGLVELAKEEELKFRWEMLTATRRPKAAALRCSASEAAGESSPQLVLWTDEARHARCQQSGLVTLSCDLEPAASSPTAGGSPNMILVGISLSWPEPWIRIDQSKNSSPLTFGLTIDCEALRNEAPPEPALKLERLTLRHDSEISWDEWSTKSDATEEELSQTLTLEALLEGLRPEGLVFETDGLLLQYGSGSDG